MDDIDWIQVATENAEAHFEHLWWHARPRYFFMWDEVMKRAPYRRQRREIRWLGKCRRNSKRKTLRTHRDGSRR